MSGVEVHCSGARKEEGLWRGATLEDETKALIVAIVSCLLFGYVAGQARVGEPWEEVERLEVTYRNLLDTFLQYKEACFDLKDQFENATTKLIRLQAELEVIRYEYEVLRDDYAELRDLLMDKIGVLDFANLTIEPAVIELGGNVTISFYVSNILPEPVDWSFAPYIKGPDQGYSILDCITLGGHETKKISYMETPEALGNYTVEIGGLTGFFEVLEG